MGSFVDRSSADSEGGSHVQRIASATAESVSSRSLTDELLEQHRNGPLLYHQLQQSGRMLENFQIRQRLLHEQHREAYIKHAAANGTQVVLKNVTLPFPPPDTVTLFLELGSAWHELFVDAYNGDSIAKIAFETSTRISLPDKNAVDEEVALDGPSSNGENGPRRGRNSNNNNSDNSSLFPNHTSARTYFTIPHLQDAPFSYQVKISGLIEDVEKARVRIRQFLPLTVHIRVANPNDESRVLEWIRIGYGPHGILARHQVVAFYHQPQHSPFGFFQCSSIQLTTKSCNESELAEVCRAAMNVLTTPTNETRFLTFVELGIAHEQLVDGRAMIEISKDSGAMLHFPREVSGSRSSHIYCSGPTPESVMSARRYVLALMPAQLCFDLDDRELPRPLGRPSRELRVQNGVVSVRVTKSVYEPSILLAGECQKHFVVMCASEIFMDRIYAARRRLLRRPNAPGRGTQPPLNSQQFLHRAGSPVLTDAMAHSLSAMSCCTLTPYDVFRMAPEVAMKLSTFVGPLWPDYNPGIHATSTLTMAQALDLSRQASRGHMTLGDNEVVTLQHNEELFGPQSQDQPTQEPVRDPRSFEGEPVIKVSGFLEEFGIQEWFERTDLVGGAGSSVHGWTMSSTPSYANAVRAGSNTAQNNATPLQSVAPVRSHAVEPPQPRHRPNHRWNQGISAGGQHTGNSNRHNNKGTASGSHHRSYGNGHPHAQHHHESGGGAVFEGGLEGYGIPSQFNSGHSFFGSGGEHRRRNQQPHGGGQNHR